MRAEDEGTRDARGKSKALTPVEILLSMTSEAVLDLYRRLPKEPTLNRATMCYEWRDAVDDRLLGAEDARMYEMRLRITHTRSVSPNRPTVPTEEPR